MGYLGYFSLFYTIFDYLGLFQITLDYLWLLYVALDFAASLALLGYVRLYKHV